MPNPCVNKVIIGGTTKLDLTSDTVTPSTLLSGYTAHDASGAPIVGTAKAGGDYNVISIDNGDGTQNILITDAEGGGVTIEPLSVTENGTYTAPSGQAYSPVTVNVPVPESKAAQASDGMSRVASTTYTDTNATLTVEKTGTYTVRWSGYRSSTSGTNGSQLYVGNTAYGSAQTTFSVNSNGQTVKLTGVQLTAGQTITVRARSRSTSYYMWVMGLSIIEE